MALSHMLAKHHELIGIVYENRFSTDSRLSNYLKKVKYNPLKVLEKVYQKYRLRSLEKSVSRELDERYRDYSTFFKTNILEVQNINESRSVDFIKNNVPDIIIVSGTRMVKKRDIEFKTSIWYYKYAHRPFPLL